MDEFPVKQTLANDCNKHLPKDFQELCLYFIKKSYFLFKYS